MSLSTDRGCRTFDMNKFQIFSRDRLFLIFTLCVLFTLFSPSFFYTSNSAIVLLICAFCFYWENCKRFIERNKKSIYLLGLSLIIGIVFSKLPGKSTKGMYDFLRGIILILPALICVKMYAENKAGFEKISASVAIFFSLMLSLFPLFYFINNPKIPMWAYIYRNAGTAFGNVHNLINGTAILMLFCFALVLWSSLSLHWKWPLILCVLAETAFLYVCRSEGAYLALFFCVLGYLFFLKKTLQKWVLALFVGVLFFYISLFVAPEFYHHNIHFSLGGFSARSDIYASTLQAIMDSPWVGYGINTYKYLSIGQPQELKNNLLFPHQIFLEALFSLGIVGMSFLLWSLIRLLKGTVNPVLSKNFLHGFGFLAFIFLLGKGMTDAKFFGFYFSGLLGMSLGFMLSTKGDGSH